MFGGKNHLTTNSRPWKSHDKCKQNNICPLLFAENIASDNTTSQATRGNSVSIFTDSKSNMHLFRLSHTDFKNTCAAEIVDVNLQCSLGLLDVFLHKVCVGTACHGPPYKECVRRQIDTHTSGITRCIFRCIFHNADYNVWKLDAILIREIIWWSWW